MPKLQNLEKARRVYNVPGHGAVHLAPKGELGSTSPPIQLGANGWGPEVQSGRRRKLVAVID